MMTLHPWMCLILMVLITINVNATSLAHKVFLPSDKSLNPFSDPFIQKIINMDRNKLHGIMKVDDKELFMKLMQNDDILHNSLIRTADVDPYESIFDDKLDDQLALQDNIDGEWVQLMTAGPLSVNFVGNLLVLASKRDFPLARPSGFVFQHIKYPDSFRTTLAQVSGSMYLALMGAHTAMDRIQLNVQQIPNQIKTALKLVIAGSPTLIEILLPKNLEFISRVANESAAHARTTFEKFSSLQELVVEIIEANVYTHSVQTNIVEEIRSQIVKAKLEQEQHDNNINIIKTQYENSRQELEKARKEYQDARNAIPTVRGLFSFFRKIVRAVVSIITAPLRILGCILGLCYSDRGAFETARQNAIARANLLLQVLQEAEKRHAVFVEQQAAEQQKLIGVINKIAALDLDTMSEQEIVDILVESIVQMSKIKEQWGRLIQFFSKLAVQADSTQQIIVHELIDVVKDVQAHGLLIDPTDREFFVEILSITCQEVERGAHLLYVMSKTYNDISSEYMVNQIAGMNTLLLLQTDTERAAHLSLLSSNTTSTSTQIIQLAQERQNEYILRNKARREEFERFLAKVAREETDVVVA